MLDTALVTCHTHVRTHSDSQDVPAISQLHFSEPTQTFSASVYVRKNCSVSFFLLDSRTVGAAFVRYSYMYWCGT